MIGTNRDFYITLIIFLVLIVTTIIGGIIVHKRVKKAEKAVESANLAVKI